MMFRTAAVVATTSTTILFAAGVTGQEQTSICYDYSDSLTMDLGPEECTASRLMKKLRNAFKAARSAPGASRCRGGFSRDLQALTGTTDDDAAWEKLHELCDTALEDASKAVGTGDWKFLQDEPIQIPLEEFFEGNTYLNLETGNFQQEESDFIKKGGYERFITIGEDPRLNDHYPTSDQSYRAGQAVSTFYQDQARKKFLSPPEAAFKGSCQETNAAMCCWSRDRQYFDKNGNCAFQDCAKQNPSDNTDLCWTEKNDEVFPYPGDETENDLHCHGFSWGKDEAGFDANSSGRWNNLFYVSLYDHMYQRGYVESITNDPKIVGDQQPMCGCVEDMAPVARADCTEIVGLTSYTMHQDPTTKLLVVNYVPDTFELEFEQCHGYEYVEDFGPEDYEADPKSKKLKRSKNDLAAFVYGQYLEGMIDKDHMDAVGRTVVGGGRNDVRKNDNKRTEACKAAFEERFPGRAYEEVDTTALRV